jgi:hypothetical protein
MAGRFTAGILVVGCLLVPRSLFAQGEDAGSPVRPVATEEKSLEQRVEALESEKTEREDAAAREKERLEQRVEELEAAKVAQEDATRSIIRQTFSEWGSKINEFVDFGGVIEVLPGWEEDFLGKDAQSIRLNTAELKFEISATDWARGSLVLEYDEASDLVFVTEEDDSFSVDKINIDTAFVTLGNTERFWPYASFGRMVVPFGISTGDPVADVLTIVDPLTVEIFETKEDALLIGFEFPTPAPTPEAVAVAPPPVRPLVVAPALAWLGRLLGYRPFPAPPPTPEHTTLTPPLPPFIAGVYFYDGDTFEKLSREGEWDLEHNMGAMLGYRARGTCLPYLGGQPTPDDLSWLHVLCPWKLDLGVELNRSVFESNFLSFEYRKFIGERVDESLGLLHGIGFVPGMASSVKATLGPVGLVAEWNGALREANFLDDTFLVNGTLNRISIRPRAWQVSLGYQFGWNPSVEAIGAQGTYLAVGYSASQDLGGVQRFIGPDAQTRPGTLDRVGFVPRRQLLVGVGEWVVPNLRLALEYARAWDYSKGHGGTNRVADGIFSMVTFEW